MADAGYGDIGVEVGADFVATVELRRPPNNFFDTDLMRNLADALLALDDDPGCRAIVLAAQGKHFCAGANLPAGGDRVIGDGSNPLYDEAVRIFSAKTPIVAAVQGAAIGGGLGLALAADFRVACSEARFAANFAVLGFHHGFGLTVTLPAVVGQQHALDILYTGRRMTGDEAYAVGLCDRLVPLEDVRGAAHEMAARIAQSAPLAVRSIRETMRGDLAVRVRQATDRENAEQQRLRKTADFAEGVRATSERRPPNFTGS